MLVAANKVANMIVISQLQGVQVRDWDPEYTNI